MLQSSHLGTTVFLNPYDICVANKEMSGHQMTVLWHVHDVKILHVNAKEVDKIIELLRRLYEDENED